MGDAELDVNPLVSVHIGITIPGPQEYSSIRTDVTFQNVNVLADIEPQLERCLEVAKQVYGATEQQLAEQAANASTLGIEGMGLAGRFDDFEKFARKRIEQIVEEMLRQKKIVDDLTPKDGPVYDTKTKKTTKKAE